MSDKENSKITGQAYDREGRKQYEMYGSWLDEISIRNVETGSVEKIWEEEPLVNNAHMQYYFNKRSMMINYKSKEMEGYVAPTDSRWRGDLRFFEEGHLEQADIEKINIEQRQRKMRKLMEDGHIPKFKPNFFRQITHPFVRNDELPTGEEQPLIFELVEGDKGYWERRERQDWSDLPNLWGPFDQN